jgi:hypothetical protein
MNSGGTIKSILPLGSVFQATVSVIAVNIQFSSPSMVRRSFSIPGILNKKKINNNVYLINYVCNYNQGEKVFKKALGSYICQRCVTNLMHVKWKTR